MPMQATSDQRKRLEIRDFGPKGRGIIALEDIKKGELVERSPVLVIAPNDRDRVDESVLFTYVFMWESGTSEEELYHHRNGRIGVVLGYTSLCNHSPNPNCDFNRHIEEKFLDLVAARDIKAGEELSIDYQMTLWFNPNS